MTVWSLDLGEHGPITVTLPAGLTKEQLLAFRPFNEWTATLARSLALQSRESHAFHADPYRLRSIEVQAVDSWRPPRVGFAKMIATVANSAGETLPGGVFLRGGSVAMLVILTPDDAPADDVRAEQYVVLTVQPRIPAGSLAFSELPAGMVDDAGSFAGAAATEIKEELGLEIGEDELVCLSDLAAAASADSRGRTESKDEDEALPGAMYPSAGGCDECVRLYLHRRRVPRAQLAEWAGRLTGLRDEGEKITLRLVRLEDLWREGARDAKALGAAALYSGLMRDGRI